MNQQKQPTEFVDNFYTNINNTLKILCIGDPHFKNDNIEYLDRYIDNIVNIVKTKEIEYVIILGDLLHYHERLYTLDLLKVEKFIDNLRQLAYVYIIVGNHDYIDNSQFLSDKHWMNPLKKWKNVWIVDDITYIDTELGFFVLCPYVFPNRFVEALDSGVRGKEWVKSRGIFCHQEFYGCKMGPIKSIEGDVWNENHPFVISGHIHDKQWIQRNVFYPGSSLQHAFGESHDKTITFATYHGDRIIFEHLDLGLPKKKILYKNIKELEDFDEKMENEDRYRITVDGTYEEYKQFSKSKKYKKMIKNGYKIVYKKKMEKINNEDSIENTDIKKQDNFKDILYSLIVEDDEYLLSLYKRFII